MSELDRAEAYVFNNAIVQRRQNLVYLGPILLTYFSIHVLESSGYDGIQVVGSWTTRPLEGVLPACHDCDLSYVPFSCPCFRSFCLTSSFPCHTDCETRRRSCPVMEVPTKLSCFVLCPNPSSLLINPKPADFLDNTYTESGKLKPINSQIPRHTPWRSAFGSSALTAC